MALLLPSPEVLSICRRRHEFPAGRIFQTKCRNVRFRVCSSANDVGEVKILNNDGWLYGVFSAEVKESGAASFPTKKAKEEEERKQNYYVNAGYAIRTLREEFPALFYKELNFDIYRDDIVFRDPLNTFAGINNYKSIFSALRFYGRIFFRALWVDVMSVWQPSENLIMIRWTVHGIPRIPWESRGRFDGTSEYKLDKDGKIYAHRVHNIALNAPPKFQAPSVEHLIQSIGCHSTARPTYFEISWPSMKDVFRIERFKHLKDSLASILIRPLGSNAESSRTME